ncbi:uncharacterized protein LOC142328160 [Lycorma delicatula]|uniref:uncharacterized protein LOC142328160 n=1 Tax=Lycorma delicatula TaxID=130591 RepID=UPI003F5155AC
MTSATFYNQLEITPPPLLSFKLCCKNPDGASKKLKYLLEKAVKLLNDQSNLHKESATLSRLIYRWKWILRNDKGFKALEKVNRSLLQYLALDMVSIMEKALEKVYDDYGPSKQMLEWVLVRLQGFTKLFDNIYHRCIEAATYLKWRFQNGHVWSVALIGTAVVSRIWVISQYLIRESCNWYSQLKQMLPVLQPSFQPWLPSGYTLPENLVAWLGHPDYVVSTHNINSNAFSFLNKTESTEEENEAMLIDNDKVGLFKDVYKISNIEIKKEDIGEVISRNNEEENYIDVKILKKNVKESDKVISKTSIEENETSNRQKRKKSIMKNKNNQRLENSNNNNNNKTNHIDTITTVGKLIRFIKYQKVLRKSILNGKCNNDIRSRCLTHNMDKLQWRMFQKFIKDKVQQVNDNPDIKKYILDNVKKEIKVWIS